MWLTGEKMISRFLLLMVLSCCVCGTLVVNVAHTSYQAEENQDVTLEWTFTPKPDNSTHLFVTCDLLIDNEYVTLFVLREGVEDSESQDDEFLGRVQWDKDVFRDGLLRLHVSSLWTEDSGEYTCDIITSAGSGSDKCQLTVTAPIYHHSYEINIAVNRGESGLFYGLFLTVTVALALVLFVPV